tara:strand:- start:14463 stop:15071 length:609 start_codon:yes stop_codon:yes gene_type:complete
MFNKVIRKGITMQVKEDFDNLIESCGGEDLLRYLIKDEGVENWETVTLNPIIAYSPTHMDSAVICGIAYWNGSKFEIIHSEELWEFDSLNAWLNNTMAREGFRLEAEALLAHNKAIIVTEKEIEENNTKTWEKIITEVVYGFRGNNYGIKKSKSLNDDFNLLASFFDILLDVKNNSQIMNDNQSIGRVVDLDFPTEWKNKWV